MKFKFAAALAATVMTLAACQKESDDAGTTPATGDYQPTTAGSTWQYSSTGSGAYTETAIGGDTTIEGETYAKIDNSESGRRYIHKANGIYKAYGYIADLDQHLKTTFLKDQPAGTAWTETVTFSVSGFTVPVSFNYTIANRDGDKTVNGKTYNDVIAVDVAISANSILLGGNVPIAAGRQFYAKGVGTISSSLDVDFQGTTATDSTYLVSHDVK